MAKQTHGRFITLEGGEGTGKSTLQSALVERLTHAGLKVISTREPGGTPLAESVRRLALHPPEGQIWSPMAEALLMNAARSDHLEKIIRPALERGEWVVCDRFADSTRAYQSVSGGVSMEMLKTMEASVLRDTIPDVTFVLDASAETTVKRRKVRSEVVDAFEARPESFHQDVRKAFLRIAESDPKRCVVIDAAADQNAVLKDVLNTLVERFVELQVQTA